jgi:glycerol-3-phosphate dehydrogenase (NAD(P)+)
MTAVSIIGATTWGNTLASLIAANGMPVRVWAHKKEKAALLQEEQSRKKGISVGCVEFTADIECVSDQCDVAVFAVPAQSLRKTARMFSGKLKGSAVLVSAAKGLEADTGKRMTEILAEEVRPDCPERLVVVSGPNLSREINEGLPAVTVVASTGSESAALLRDLLASGSFSTYTSNDVKGVEICGALKNVIALGAGMVDGLHLGSNAKAALVTVGWQEVTRLGKELGAQEDTFYGFAGLGDLVTTCISPLSRNYHVGYQMAGGKTLAQVLAEMSNVVEGVDTASATNLLCNKSGLDLPLMQAIYRVLSGHMPAAGITGYFLNGRKPA